MKTTVQLFATFLFGIVFLGCGQSPDDAAQSQTEELPAENTITLEPIVSLESFGDHYISGIRTPMPASNGDIIISEFSAQQLFRISADGELLQTIGRDGRGPGEFQSIYSLLMAPGDSLHVFDINNSRHQVFGTDGETWRSARELERMRPNAGTEGRKQFAPSRVFEADGELFGLFRNHIVVGDTATMYQSWISRVNHNLHPADDEEILLKTGEDALVIRMDNRGIVTNTHPFSYRLFRNWNPNEQLLAEISNENAELRHYNVDGELIRSVQLPYEKLEADVAARADYERQMSEYGNEAVQLTRSKHLPFEPLVREFIADDEGRYWIQMSRSDTDSPNWIVFSAAGEILGAVTFHIDFEAGTATMPMLIQNNRLYAMHYEEFEPSFRIFDIQF
ncbi:MAG: hypothetical protein LAT84_02365 [Balneolia bacterium]|nr:hypothetical protein [Balneolia bacterium]